MLDGSNFVTKTDLVTEPPNKPMVPTALITYLRRSWRRHIGRLLGRSAYSSLAELFSWSTSPRSFLNSENNGDRGHGG